MTGMHGAAACSCTLCASQKSDEGLLMTKTTDAGAAGAQTPSRGLLARVLTKAFGAMTPEERKELIADAAVSAGVAGYTAKAHDIMDGKDVEIEQIEDLWDGAPDMMPPHSQVAGHSGDHSGGKIMTGPGQSASGNGAAKMSREYAKPAPQGGVAETTNKLGEMLSMKAMKALIKAVEGQSRQSELLTSAVVTLVDELAAVKASVKSLRLRKAEKEDDKEGSSGEETEEEEADDEAEDSESGSGTEIEITNEMDDEDEAESDEDKKAAKSASKSRVLAKGRVALARARLMKATEAGLDGKTKLAARHQGVAKAHIAKAKELFAAAKAQRPEAVVRLGALEKSLRTVAKALQSKAENQEKWPATTEKPAGSTAKAADPGAQTTVQPDVVALQASIKAMQAQLDEANQGLGLFKTNVAGVMNAIGGQSRGNGQAPVVLAKGGATVAASETGVREKISSLVASGQISQRDAESAEDVLGHIVAISKGMNIDPMIPKLRIQRMPEPLQAVFSEAA